MNYKFENIIIAEDDPLIVEIYRDIIHERTKNIHSVSSGIALINKVLELLQDSKKIDLILLDDNMPLKSGTDAIDILPLLNAHFAEVRVLLISGNIKSLGPAVPSKTKNHCMLSKPFNLKDLDRCLNCCSFNFKQYCDQKLKCSA